MMRMRGPARSYRARERALWGLVVSGGATRDGGDLAVGKVTMRCDDIEGFDDDGATFITFEMTPDAAQHYGQQLLNAARSARSSMRRFGCDVDAPDGFELCAECDGKGSEQTRYSWESTCQACNGFGELPHD